MKFCKHCGNQIPDNAVCNCPGAVAERQAQQGAYQQQGYQQPAYQAQRPPRQGGGIAVLPTFLNYFKNPLKTSAERKQAKDFITPLIILGAMFFLLWGVNSCIFGNAAVTVRSSDALKNFKNYPLYGYNFGFVVLASLIETVAYCGIYVVVKFLLTALFVKPLNAGKAFIDSFISFGVHSIVPIMAMVVGGLFYMATAFIGQIFFGFALLWYIIMLISEVFAEVPGEKRGFAFFAALICVLTVGLYGTMMTFRLSYQMNMGHSVINTVSTKYDATGWNKSKNEADDKAITEAMKKNTSSSSSSSSNKYGISYDDAMKIAEGYGY